MYISRILIDFQGLSFVACLTAFLFADPSYENAVPDPTCKKIRIRTIDILMIMPHVRISDPDLHLYIGSGSDQFSKILVFLFSI